MAVGGAASMATEGEAEADAELPVWEKLSPRSTGAPEEDEAAWILSLAISKLQTQTHTQTHPATNGKEA